MHQKNLKLVSFFGERKNRYIFATLFQEALNSTFKPEKYRICHQNAVLY
jgi:hypothetical protein